MSSYSQWKAFKAVLKASLKSTAKSPSSIIFTIAFPLVFILAFSFLGNIEEQKIEIAFSEQTDTSSALFHQLIESEFVNYQYFDEDLDNKLREGKVTMLLNIQHSEDHEVYHIDFNIGNLNDQQMAKLKMIIENIILKEKNINQTLISFEERKIEGNEFKPIDFILPGQLGFSLLAASIFGTAFVFFNLRTELVLKRFFATPIKRQYILLAEGASRMIFQLMGAVLIICIGYFGLGFTLANGFWSFLNMLVLSALALLVFMAFGFIISGIAKSSAVIPPISNILVLPQFLLAGTFFPIADFPAWLQPISKILPLTFLNDALRKIAFEGANLWMVKIEILVLLLWGIIGYAIAARLFKWE